jgi:uncharacterized membrane protein
VVTRCFGWQLNFDYHVTMLIVLWALGWAMIVLSALVWLPASPVSAKFMVGHPIAGRSFFCAWPRSDRGFLLTSRH